MDRSSFTLQGQGSPVCIAHTRVSAVVFSKTSQMHTLYCIYNTDRREADPSVRDCASVIGSDVPWLDCPASNALTWVVTVTE